MTDVQFTEEATLTSRPALANKGSGMAGWIVRQGWVKDQAQAEYLLIGIIVVAFATTALVLFFGMAGPNPAPPAINPTVMPGPGGVPSGTLR